MAKKILTNWDFQKNQILNVRIHNSASHLSNPAEGLMYFNTTDKCFYIYEDGKWVNHTILTSDRISDFMTAVKTAKLNEMSAPDGSVSMNSQKITGLADGENSSDAVNKGQLDAAMGGIASGLLYKGTFDANIPNDFSALEGSSCGDFYKISVSGTIDGIDYLVGDMIIVNKDVAGVPVTADVDKIDNTEAPDILRTDAEQTMTNKTIDADDNTISNLETDNFKSGVIVTDLTAATDTEIATAKTVADAIDSEMDRAMLAEGDIADGLAQELIDRANADNTLQGNIDTVSDGLAQELIDRAGADSDLQDELDATQTGAGLGTDGSYSADATTNYLKTATSLKDADKKLDAEIKTVDGRITTVAGGIAEDISALQGEIDDTQVGAGLGVDGSYTPPSGSNYLGTSTSLNVADFILDGKIKDVNDDLADEITNRGIAEVNLQDAIDAVAGDLAQELIDRADADSDLSDRIGALETGGGAEVTDTHTRESNYVNNLFQSPANYTSLEARLIDIETVIDAKATTLADEIDRATLADEDLATAIGEETDRATLAEGGLQDAIDAVAGDLADEVTRATGAEGDLSDRLDTLEAVVNKFAGNIGNGTDTDIVVTHSLGTKDVIVQIYEVATGDEVFTDVNRTSTNTVTFSFAVAPTTNEFRVVIMK
jgi:hypothetical protein